MLGHGDRFVGGHLHQIGRRCVCGYLAVPNRFHNRDGAGKIISSQEQAEGAYLAWLGSGEKPVYVDPPVMEEIKRDNVPKKRGRPKKWKDETERKRAYRHD